MPRRGLKRSSPRGGSAGHSRLIPGGRAVTSWSIPRPGLDDPVASHADSFSRNRGREPPRQFPCPDPCGPTSRSIPRPQRAWTPDGRGWPGRPADPSTGAISSGDRPRSKACPAPLRSGNPRAPATNPGGTGSGRPASTANDASQGDRPGSSRSQVEAVGHSREAVSKGVLIDETRTDQDEVRLGEPAAEGAGSVRTRAATAPRDHPGNRLDPARIYGRCPRRPMANTPGFSSPCPKFGNGKADPPGWLLAPAPPSNAPGRRTASRITIRAGLPLRGCSAGARRGSASRLRH